MSANPWSKFFWQDWESDQALKLCSLAAQGLWMRMLCIAAAHDPIGYVAVAGKPLDETALARLTGAAESEVASLLGELGDRGVFSRDRHGRIYSRRIIRDARKAVEAKKNGKKGGNPSLGNKKGNSRGVNPWDKGGDKPHKPEASNQSIPLSNDNGPDDPDKVFWETVKGYLGKSRGALIGKLAKEHGKDALAAAVTTAMLQTTQPPDRVSYVIGILRKNQRANADDFSSWC